MQAIINIQFTNCFISVSLVDWLAVHYRIFTSVLYKYLSIVISLWNGNSSRVMLCLLCISLTLNYIPTLSLMYLTVLNFMLTNVDCSRSAVGTMCCHKINET
jgi:hypothetical protein